MLTDEEKDRVLHKVGTELKQTFPRFQGNIQFNLKPGRAHVNLNLNGSKVLRDEDFRKGN